MKRLWAPWRIPWIRATKDGVTDCFLCDYRDGSSGSDRDNLVLHRGETAFVVLNRYPYVNGHLMVSPNRHISDPRQLTSEEWGEITSLTNLSLDVLDKALDPHGFNIGWNIGRIAGAGLEEHIHQHIVPRWSGDTNCVPVIGQVKVISQDLWESYDELSTALMEILRK